MFEPRAIKNENGMLMQFDLTKEADLTNDLVENGLKATEQKQSNKLPKKNLNQLKEFFLNSYNYELIFRTTFDLFQYILVKATAILKIIFASCSSQNCLEDFSSENSPQEICLSKQVLSKQDSIASNLLNAKQKFCISKSYCSTQVSECNSPISNRNKTKRKFQVESTVVDQKKLQKSLQKKLQEQFKDKFQIKEKKINLKEEINFSFEENKFNEVFEIQKSLKINKKQTKFVALHRIEDTVYEVQRIELKSNSNDFITNQIQKLKILIEFKALPSYSTSWLERKFDESGKVKKTFLYVQLLTLKNQKNLKQIAEKKQEKFLKHVFYVFNKVTLILADLQRKGIYLEQVSLSNLKILGKQIEITNIAEQLFQSNSKHKYLNEKQNLITSINNLGYLYLEMLLACNFNRDECDLYMNEARQTKKVPSFLENFHNREKDLIEELIQMNSKQVECIEDIKSLQSYKRITGKFTFGFFM